MFYAKKIVWIFAPTPSPGHCLGPPGGLTAPSRPPAAIIFGLAKNRCAHIFFLHYPDIKNYIHTYIYQRPKVELSKQLLSNFQAENSCVHKQLEPQVKNGVAYKKIVQIRKPMFNLSLTFLLF